MNPKSPRTIRNATIAAALAIVVCTLALIVDYAVARSRAPGDDKRIEAIQREVRSDASKAPKLEAEQKRITDARHGRKLRVSYLSALLFLAAAAFLTGAKWLLANRTAQPDPPQKPLRTTADSQSRSRRRRQAPRAPAVEAIDLTFVNEIVAREGQSQEAAIPILQAIQQHYRYLPDEALRRVCEITEITPAQISGTSSFYSRFRRSPVGEHIVRVCHGTACHVSGARQITDELRRGLAIPEGSDTDPSRTFTLEEVACLGCCSLAPVLMVDEHTVGKLRPADACDALEIVRPEEPA